jgi:hypothetical protein
MEKFQTGRLDVAWTQAKCNNQGFHLLACGKCLKVRRTGRSECLAQQSPLKHNQKPLISYIGLITAGRALGTRISHTKQEAERATYM